MLRLCSADSPTSSRSPGGWSKAIGRPELCPDKTQQLLESYYIYIYNITYFLLCPDVMFSKLHVSWAERNCVDVNP
jgi:hypothetical protein